MMMMIYQHSYKHQKRKRASEVQYGGRVTDDLDKCLLNTFTRVWFSESTFSDKFCFYKGYSIPAKPKTVQDVLQHIEALPLVDSPEVFGLHPNADITYQTNLANETLSTIINIQPKDSGGGAGETREASVRRLASQLQRMGPLQPMNIFLRQEVDRMQRVISNVRSTLTDLKLAIDGTIIMSEDLRDALDCMFDARIPRLWLRLSWPSATLGFWFSELLERNQQLSSWISTGRPNQFWLTGFFNPQGFLTAMRQETTRSNLSRGWALDTVTLSNDVTKMMKEDVSAPPPEDVGGVYIYGLFLDGAGWDRRGTKLTEAPPKVLFTPLPVVHVYAISAANMADSKRQPGAVSLYLCPVYKKPRRTDLNFIFSLQLRSVQPVEHWTLRERPSAAELVCRSKGDTEAGAAAQSCKTSTKALLQIGSVTAPFLARFPQQLSEKDLLGSSNPKNFFVSLCVVSVVQRKRPRSRRCFLVYDSCFMSYMGTSDSSALPSPAAMAAPGLPLRPLGGGTGMAPSVAPSAPSWPSATVLSFFKLSLAGTFLVMVSFSLSPDCFSLSPDWRIFSRLSAVTMRSPSLLTLVPRFSRVLLMFCFEKVALKLSMRVKPDFFMRPAAEESASSTTMYSSSDSGGSSNLSGSTSALAPPLPLGSAGSLPGLSALQQEAKHISQLQHGQKSWIAYSFRLRHGMHQSLCVEPPHPPPTPSQLTSRDFLHLCQSKSNSEHS
ncbi:hypothetical protein INR49_012218, partial [Caranx melampygus]